MIIIQQLLLVATYKLRNFYPVPDTSIGLFACFFLSLFFCQQDYEKTAGPICTKFLGKVWSDHGTTWLHFSSIPRNRAMPRCATRGRGLLCFSTTACFTFSCHLHVFAFVFVHTMVEKADCFEALYLYIFITIRALQRNLERVILFSAVSVCGGLSVCQHDNSWTVRDIITTFSGHHPMVRREVKFKNGCRHRMRLVI